MLTDGADHFITIPYEEVRLATCPVRAVEQIVDSGEIARRMGHGSRLSVATHSGRGGQSTSERVVVANSTTDDRPT